MNQQPTIRAIPQGGETWAIYLSGSFATYWHLNTNSSAIVIEDYCANSNEDIDDYIVIEDI